MPRSSDPYGSKQWADEFKRRTMDFGLRVVKLVASLPDKPVVWDIGRQLLRSGTSVGANYRAACRARSKAEFAAKLGIVEEEVDEAVYWMELVIEAGFMQRNLVEPLMAEGREITAMVVASINTVRRRLSEPNQ